MSEVFLQRRWPEPLDADSLVEMAKDSLGCFGLHRVRWQESFLSADGKNLLCHFSAPDAESVRIALRQLNADMRDHWPGSVHHAPGLTDLEVLAANVVVTRRFDSPVELSDIQAIEDANIHCLANHRVRFMRSFFSSDQRKMACFYQAPDAESVRIAQRLANLPVNTVWAFNRLSPDTAQ